MLINTSKLIRLITLLICLIRLNAFAQSGNDSILDGASLLNLKHAQPNRYYKYILTTDCYTLLKFKKGKIIDYIFNSTTKNNLKVDTFYYTDKSGLAIQLNKKIRNPRNVIHISNSKDELYLNITVFDTLPEISVYNLPNYYYYHNKQLCSISKPNKTGDTVKTINYTEKGLLGSIEIQNTLETFKEATIYLKNGNIDFKFKTIDGIHIREQYDGKGNLTQIDSTDANYKHIGTFVKYYPNKVIKSKLPFKEGKIDGVAFTYFEDGKIMTLETYLQNKKIGRYIYYNKDGSVKKEGIN